MLQSSTFSHLKNLHHAVGCCLALLLFLTQLKQSAALIVPNEVPSILSLVYSNIPPIKKGTDSRLGFGFRLGEHADFQVLLELGPQKETRPIGDQDNSDGSSFNKRQVNKIQQLRIQQDSLSKKNSAATWLEKWSNDVNSAKNKSKTTKKQIPYKTAGMPVMPHLPDQTLRQLQMLYKMATTSTTENTLSSTENQLPSTETTPMAAKYDATHLRERLKVLKAPANVEELQVLHHKPIGKTKAEITKELMDVNLDE